MVSFSELGNIILRGERQELSFWDVDFGAPLEQPRGDAQQTIKFVGLEAWREAWARDKFENHQQADGSTGHVMDKIVPYLAC